MTTRFSSKSVALGAGLYYAGSKQKIEDLKVKATEKISSPIDPEPEKNARPLEVYDVINADGKTIEIGIEQAGNKFYLWFIDSETGMTLRA